MIYKRLKDSEAVAIGVDVKPQNKYGNAKYYLSDEQIAKLDDIRSVGETTNYHGMPTPDILLNPDNEQRKNLVIVGTSELKKGDEVVMEWVKKSVDKQKQIDAAEDIIKGLMSELMPTPPTPLLIDNFNDSLLSQYTLTDFHFGMMAWSEETGADWDMEIAEEMLVRWFQRAIQSSPNSKVAILANIGDFLHWDGLDAVTPTSKHVLDADTRFSKLVRVAVRSLRKCIRLLLDKHEHVHIKMVEGNHDESSSSWLREVFDMYYEDEPRVTVDTSPSVYQYYGWGDVFLGYTHGHKSNFKKFESVFISRFKVEYGVSKHAYVHCGHYHSTKVETNLMIVEQHPTLAAKDAYSARGGYDSCRNAKVITYHKLYGEVARSTINPDMLL